MLIYTLLKDGPRGSPVLRKVLIVVPSSMVSGWKKEFTKWIKIQYLKVLTLTSKDKKTKNEKLQQYCINGISYPVLIIGYEMLRNCIDIVSKAKIDLIVCDEGHRLKNKKGNQTINALKKISTKRRIILTGTPMQNNLSELFAMCDYVNPGCLNDYKIFKKVYETPIMISRDINCNKFDKRIGDERSLQLNEITKQFTLRRTANINKKYLPKKDEYIVFHKMSSLQSMIYNNITTSKSIKNVITTNSFKNALPCISYLRLLCVSPKIIADKRDDIQASLNITFNRHILNEFKNNYEILNQKSEKLCVLMNLLGKIKKQNDKCVVISNFATALNQVGDLLTQIGYKFIRLDGSTLSHKRQALVNQFNRDNSIFCFLISSKAGGVGINLPGGNHCILIDPSWNPSDVC